VVHQKVDAYWPHPWLAGHHRPRAVSASSTSSWGVRSRSRARPWSPGQVGGLARPRAYQDMRYQYIDVGAHEMLMHTRWYRCCHFGSGTVSPSAQATCFYKTISLFVLLSWCRGQGEREGHALPLLSGHLAGCRWVEVIQVSCWPHVGCLLIWS
jgi:hypothetical protein